MDMKSNASQDLGLNILWFSNENIYVCIFSGLWSGCQPGPVLLFVPSGAVFSSLVEYQARRALSSLANEYLFI